MERGRGGRGGVDGRGARSGASSNCSEREIAKMLAAAGLHGDGEAVLRGAAGRTGARSADVPRRHRDNVPTRPTRRRGTSALRMFRVRLDPGPDAPIWRIKHYATGREGRRIALYVTPLGASTPPLVENLPFS